MQPVQAAYTDFATLLSLFPDSQYAPDVKQRMIHLRNILADYELVVADYYMRRGAYIAAANRARYVLETYPNTLATPDAIVVLVECNWRLGLETETDNLLRVLALNYPDHENFDENGNLILENEVISAPVIRSPILGGSGQIEGGFSVEEANNLAILLRAGALPALSLIHI